MIRAAKSIFLLFALIVCPIAHADQRELKTDENSKVDAVLLLDASGSMLQTDPHRLRDEGAKLFVQFLRPGDRVAVMQFDRAASVIRPFSEFNRDMLPAIGADIARVGTEGTYTDLLAGIKEAAALLQKEGRADASGMIVLLSDGKMEPDPAIGAPYGRTEELMNSVLPDLKSKGIRIHTLCFSDQADKQLLSEIAIATEGIGSFTPDSDKIHESFANLFLAVKKPQVMPLTGKGFTIDGDVQEATFYVNREESAELVLVDPAGHEIKAASNSDKIKWFKGQKFDVITVLSPESGNWHVNGLTSTDGFATLLTNLKLVSDWPTVVVSDEPTLLQARLNEGDKPVILPEISGSTRYGLQVIPTDRVSEPIVEDVLYDDGTHGDKISGDGIFSYKVNIEQPGEYKLWVVAKGPTFDRRQQIPFRVKPPLISLSISTEQPEEHKVVQHSSALEGKSEEEKGAPANKEGHEEEPGGKDTIQIKISQEAALMKNIVVKLSAIDDQRRKFNIPIERGLEENVYEVSADKLPHEGIFEIQATLTAESKKKGSVHEESKIVRYKRKKLEGNNDAVVEVIVDKKVDEKPSAIPYAILVMLVNGIVGYLGIGMLKKNQTKSTFVLPTFKPADPALGALTALGERVALTEISFTDPILQNEVILPTPSGAVSSVSVDQAASPAASPNGSPGAEPDAAGAPSQEAGGDAGTEGAEPSGDADKPAGEAEQ